ncbi:MFS transporter [Bacillus atrophaeus]|uniref:Efflux transporter n=1 Tax=Bacillus atrophaeus (strain 1942) TaxID=720555 RepID=A0ABM5LTM1_BACA1|nr:MFS transporter [Bacillus atrophaeus]AMR63798.1 Fosmidomycin resistance protein [Bacillus subtilis subsp. globigii]ADP31209.1 putative efflux transporter [Bacillus atrophaeus 1942]AIK48090.1 major Facilitator Superfamily protein [Bacillus atrophaeus subsp. globigii]EIM09379.1 putative efflux transporter [Bacillus atrophaeus C89]KFK81441.1 major Facilitator Superfamily protein [Bacillus atrophaeus]
MAIAAPLKEKPVQKPGTTVYSILVIIGICHLLNDSLQAVIPAMFPILERSMSLTFTQLGIIAFTLNMVSSVMQPVIGWYADKRPMPYALPLGLTSSMLGILGLAFAPSFLTVLCCVFFIGLGSAVFHPEGSRVAYMAAGSKRGLAQSIYQVGGNSGQAMAPLITALILVPLGQFGAVWFTLVAALAVLFLIYIAKWYTARLGDLQHWPAKKAQTETKNTSISKSITAALIIIIFLIFARSWYVSAIGNFYTFYAMDTYHVSIRQAQSYIFVFLLFGAVGTFLGGPLADRFGKRTVIIFSLLVSAPLAILLPFAGPVLAYGVLALIGVILMSSFSVTVVYAQELVPGKIGTMSGLTVGLAFGMGAIGAVALGALIDSAGLTPTMIAIAFLPILGILAVLLPSDQKLREWHN